LPPPQHVLFRNLPIRLTKLPRLVNNKMVYKLTAQEGGMCEIAVQLCPLNAEKLGEFCIQTGNIMPYQPLSTIQLFHRYPASGRAYCEPVFSRIARSFAPFRAVVKKPFLPRNDRMTNVGFDILGGRLRNAHKAVWKEMKEITPLRAQEAKVFPFLPVTFVGWKRDGKHWKTKETDCSCCFEKTFASLHRLRSWWA
jgi:hypothetical protein